MRSAEEWARMLQPDSIGRMADPAWVIARAQDEARRAALEEAARTIEGEDRFDWEDATMRAATSAIRALAAKVAP